MVIWSIQIGGAETFATGLCKDLSKKGHRAILFPVFSPWDVAYVKKLEAEEITIRSPFRNTVADWFLWKLNAITNLFGKSIRQAINRGYVKRLIRREKIDVIISNSIVADVFVYENNTRKLPHVVVEHGEYSYGVIDSTPLDLRAIHAASQVVSVSKWCQQTIAAAWNISSKVIYNGHQKASTFNTAPPADEPFIFCMIGRAVEFKGWDEAIAAFLLAKEQIGNCKLVLIGGGDYLDQLKTAYQHIPELEFTGRLTNPLEVVQRVHVGLVPSRRYEAFGIVILDFFSFGKPVLAANTGAIGEVVHYDGKLGGVLVDVENGKVKIDALARHMVEIAKNRTLYQTRSRDAAAIYRSFLFEHTANQYEAVLKNLVS